MTSLLAGLACGRREAPVASAPLPTATVRLCVLAPAQESGWVAVTLAASQRATLATRMAASVKRVHVTEGQRVAAGALLVSLADEDLQAGRQAAETAVATAQTQVRRMERLAAQDAATPAERDQAQVQLAQARAGLAGVQANLGYTQIRAPFAGVVQARRVNEGDFVSPGTPLLELEGQGALEFTGSVSAAEARGLKLGQTVPFECEGQTGTAQITGLATGGDPVSQRGSLRARVVKGTDGLRSGAFGRLRVPGVSAASQDMTVPASAMVRRGELNGVFLARGGLAQLRWLSLGAVQGDRIAVRAGLAQGDLVIDAPAGLQDGQPIEVAR
jgi:RND family efflux transporter MFP subunit